MLPVESVRDAPGLPPKGPPPPVVFVSVASKELSLDVSGLESTLRAALLSVDSKRTYIALKLCRNRAFLALRGGCSFQQGDSRALAARQFQENTRNKRSTRRSPNINLQKRS